MRRMWTICALLTAVAGCGVAGTPNIGGNWIATTTDKLSMTLTQSGDHVTGVLASSGFDHTIAGDWNVKGDGFDVRVTRTSVSNGCVTIMTARITVLSGDTIRVHISGTDGRCDLQTSYTEDRDWTSN